MDTSKLMGQRVMHISYGSGVIVNINANQLQVNFEFDGLKRFQFPQAFGTYLTIDDEDIMTEILKEKQIRKQEEERKRCEEEEKARLHSLQEKEKRLEPVSSAKPNRRQGGSKSVSDAFSDSKIEQRTYDVEIIGPETSFATHAETFNACFGFHFVHYQKAYKMLGNGYAVWFPRIAKKVAGQYLSSDNYEGWLNILSDTGDTITQMDNPDFPRAGWEPDNLKRLVFARFEGDNRYRFIGVYANEERIQDGVVFTRIGTKFDTKKMIIVT